MVIRQVLDMFQRLVTAIYVSIGLKQGKTLLPLPPADATMGDESQSHRSTKDDKERVHVLETAVNTWTRQIKNVLKTDPEQVLLLGQEVGPLAELDFWECKAANLVCISEQLSGERIKKVLRVLEVTKSSYHAPFARLCKDVAVAEAEASNNSRFLSTLRGTLRQIGRADLTEVAELFRPFFHRLLQVWKHSQHYNTPARLAVLLRQLCGALVAKARAHICAGQLFSLDPPEALERLLVTLKVPPY